MARQFAGDLRAVWRYGAPFPTFLKLIASLLLCLIVIMPLLYPLFVVAVTYFTCETLFYAWWYDDPCHFQPANVMRHVLVATSCPYSAADMWKVRDFLTRGILLTHSLATSIDYLCVMQGLLDDT